MTYLPKPGDIIRFPRVGYSHFAIYVGEGKVIHFSGPRDEAMLSPHKSTCVDVGIPSQSGEAVDRLLEPDVNYEDSEDDDLETLLFFLDNSPSGSDNVDAGIGQDVDTPDVVSDYEAAFFGRLQHSRSQLGHHPMSPSSSTADRLWTFSDHALHQTARSEEFGVSTLLRSVLDTVGTVVDLIADTARNKADGAQQSVLDQLGLTETADKCAMAMVRVDKLYHVVNQYAPEVCNYLDDKYTPFPGVEVVARARSRLGERGYDILRNNCEHFVTWCRYDVQHCEQVDKFERVLMKKGNKLSNHAFEVKAVIRDVIKERFEKEAKKSSQQQ